MYTEGRFMFYKSKVDTTTKVKKFQDTISGCVRYKGVFELLSPPCI